MGVIHCCGGLRSSKSFVLEPEIGYIEARFDWVESCRKRGKSDNGDQQTDPPTDGKHQ